MGSEMICRLLTLVLLISTAALSAGAEIDFMRDVRPIFRAHCYDCHDGESEKSGLRLDVNAAAFRGGSGHAPNIVPGDPEASSLLQFVSASPNAELKMPPKGKRLPKKEIKVLRRWIEQGAPWPESANDGELDDRTDHWSFKPIVRPDGGKDDIDAFILHRLQEKGLSLSPPADPAIWLRRVTLDLTGLPPTAEEVEAFLADHSDTARAAVVDRLLASPRHGERWAQHWLDVVRYADTSGFEVNRERRNAWPYRDYVIEALNNDVPYDQFIREQLAGDAFQENRSTGFLVTSAVLLPGQIGKDDASKRLARQDELTEMVTNVGETFLGLSIGCARCHDHKFDAITAQDFYSMQAFLSGVKFGERPNTNPVDESMRLDLINQVTALERQLLELTPVANAPPPNTIRNIDRFDPIPATKVRFVIEGTMKDNFREPFIDELEVYDLTGNNIALGERGVIAKDSGNGGNSLAKLNDGLYGNENAWRGKVKGEGWVQLEFTNEMMITAVGWSRDRLGKYRDRLAVKYRIEVTGADGKTHVVASEKSRSNDNSAPTGKWESIEAKALELHKEVATLTAGGMIYSGIFSSPEPISLLRRGDPEQPVSPVSPAAPIAIGEALALENEASDRERRKALADWIASPQNPLTARVIANRVWQWHFGMGLVETANDFGRAGAPPTHPELLDWLAAELIDSGWSLKHLHRLITLSATYAQSNRVQTSPASVDADVRYLWRYPSRRLEAEALRDSMLFVSGRLNLKTGGRGFSLFDQRGGLSGFTPITESNDENRRRMIFAHKIRMEREAVFGAFDCPDGGQSMPRRRQSTTPVQALNLFNSQFTIDEATAFAKRVSSVREAWLLAYGREPDPEEAAAAEQFVEAHGWPTLLRAVYNSNEFVLLP